MKQLRTLLFRLEADEVTALLQEAANELESQYPGIDIFVEDDMIRVQVYDQEILYDVTVTTFSILANYELCRLTYELY